MDLTTNELSKTRILVSEFLAGRPKNTSATYRQAILQLHGFLVSKMGCQEGNWDALLRVDLTIAKAFAITLTQKYVGSSVGAYIAGCSGLYDTFLAHELITQNPFKHPLVKIVNKSRRAVNPTPRIPLPEVRAMLLSCDRSTRLGQRDYALLCVLFGGGLRRQEVVNLCNGDVLDGRPMVLRLYYTKTGVLEEQSLADWAAEGVETHIGNNCLEGEGANESLFKLSKEGLHKAWKRMCWRAKVKDYGLHSARCTAINRLLELGYNHGDVRKFSRHSTVAMVEQYERRYQDILINPGRSLTYF